jgi:hypothetical protein
MTLIGIHVQALDQQVKDWLYRAMPGTIKWLDWHTDALEYLSWYREHYRATYGRYPTVVGRIFEVNWNIDYTLHLMWEAYSKAKGLIDYWEALNEPPGTSYEEVDRVRGYYDALLDHADPAKFRILVGSFGEGNPARLVDDKPVDVSLLVDVLRKAKAKGGGLALHEYSQPRMTYEQGYHCLRFVKFFQMLPPDLQDIPTFITEAGIDFGAVVQGYPSIGQQGWVGKLSEDQYLEDIRWYDSMVSAYPQIKGVHLFNLGDGGGWSLFEHKTAWKVADYIRSGQEKVSQPVVVTPPSVIPTPQEAKKVLYLAIIPSNQDRNAVIGGTDERVQCHQFAAKLLSIARNYDGVVAKVIPGEPESLDRTPYQNLILQQKAAKTWLDSFRNENAIKVALNFHTDSGFTSHVGYYWWNLGHSRSLGKTICDAVAPIFATRDIRNADYSSYIFVKEQLGSPCTPLLLELGSHQNLSDTQTLANRGNDIALKIITSTLSYFGLPIKTVETTPPAWVPAKGPSLGVTWADVGYYALWANLRIGNREDPRSRQDFINHCVAIGKGTDITKYGFPGVC